MYKVIGLAAMLVGCVSQPPPQFVNVTFLDQRVGLILEDKFVKVTRDPAEPGTCPVLPASRSATWNGAPAQAFGQGGFYKSSRTGDYGCEQWDAYWPAGPLLNTAGPSTIVISDGTTAYQFVVWDHNVPRELAVVAPRDGIVRAGTRVVYRASVDSDGALTPRNPVRILVGTQAFYVTPEIVGHDISFIFPATANGTANVGFIVDAPNRIDRYDAPLGCQASGASGIEHTLTVAN